MGGPVGGGMPMMNNGAAGVRPTDARKRQPIATQYIHLRILFKEWHV